MNAGEKIRMIEHKYLRQDLPELNIGDMVKMRIKVMEADKVRVHPFEGTIVRTSRKGSSGTFTVRKISFGEGVERTFPVHSPVIEKIQVVSRGKIKRAKLYYLRDRVGKAQRVKRRETTT